jgi:serine/threonine protein phosphatase PrpC
MEYLIGQATRTGNRKHNEDRIAVCAVDDSVILVLADGMGGHEQGELAAQTLVDTIVSEFKTEPKPVARPARFINRIIKQAHDAVMDAGFKQDPPTTPCTTCVVCIVQHGYAWWAHVGDSRLYLVRDGSIQFQTRDHSHVENLLRRGEINASQAENHPMRNYLTECIGGKINYPEIDSSKKTRLKKGDTLLLCSDGLWGALKQQQLLDGIQRDNLDELSDELAYLAEQESFPGSDNISLITFRMLDPDSKPARKNKQSPASSNKTARLEGAIDEINKAIREFESEMRQK